MAAAQTHGGVGVPAAPVLEQAGKWQLDLPSCNTLNKTYLSSNEFILFYSNDLFTLLKKGFSFSSLFFF